MTPEEILQEPARILSDAQRRQYFDEGFTVVENFAPAEILAELQEVTQDFVEQSRQVSESGDVFDIGPGHSAETPVLRRLKQPDVRHDAYWRFATGIVADAAADLVGPNVVFHHSKLNFKWYDETDQVKWHQDIQFFPHTNYNVLTIGCYLEDTDLSNGALAVLPGSHNGPLYDQYGADGTWVGHLNDEDSDGIDMDQAVYLTAPAGSITIHNCRTLHYSPSSKSPKPRPLLLNCYAASDAKPYTPHPDPSTRSNLIVRGEAVRWAHHDPRPCLIPPDWSGGYSSIYAAQAGEDGDD